MSNAPAVRPFRSQSRSRRLGLCIVSVVAVLACMVGPASAATPNAVKAKLRALALNSAKNLGDAHPTNVEAVKTTYATYRKAFNGPPPRGNVSKVWVVEVPGPFKLGSHTFPWEVLIVRASDDKLAFAILGGPKTPVLAKLGPVVKL